MATAYPDAAAFGFRNRFAAGVQWPWHYPTFERGARLITGERMLPAIQLPEGTS